MYIHLYARYTRMKVVDTHGFDQTYQDTTLSDQQDIAVKRECQSCSGRRISEDSLGINHSPAYG